MNLKNKSLQWTEIICYDGGKTGLHGILRTGIKPKKKQTKLLNKAKASSEIVRISYMDRGQVCHFNTEQGKLGARKAGTVGKETFGL